MELNSFVFAAPKPSYSKRDFKNMIFIPKKSLSKNCKDEKVFSDVKVTVSIVNSDVKSKVEEAEKFIPCLMFEYPDGCDHMAIYWHANAEDLGIAASFACKLKDELKIHVLVVEFPGYGIYRDKPNSHNFLLDAEIVYEYATKKMGIDPKKIILLGKSLGSAPACHIAQSKTLSALILISPFSSLKEVVRNKIGFFSMFVADNLRNSDCLSRLDSPCLIIHGKKDEIVPYTHSIELHAKCSHKSVLHLAPTMTHNKFDFIEDIVQPIRNFFSKMSISPLHSYEMIPKLSEEILNN